MKKIDEIRNMTPNELVKESTMLRDEIAEMKRRVHLGEVQNPRVLRVKRRELARMLTILSEHLAKEKA
ncbi:50S ribosomal protein L29 [Candidatus Saccharibacteria bacterium]|nr:50S ribosomal protein L29 [Candidatus Saccharibacteria bacterium]